MSAATDARHLAFRVKALADSNVLAGERDRAIMERDNARRENKGLQVQLRIVTKERDEARALARSA